MTRHSPKPRCLSCDYSLEHLAETRCPECGRGFDPLDPTTFATVRRPPHRGWLLATALVWLHPVAVFLVPYAAWLMAWATLGYRPRASLDDPNDISLLVSVVCFTYMLTVLALPLGVMLGIVANVWLTVAARLTFSRAATLHAAFLALWIGAIALARLDPVGVSAWVFD